MFKFEGLSRNERWGMIILLMLILLSITTWQVIDFISSKEIPITENENFQKEWEVFQEKNIEWVDATDYTNNSNNSGDSEQSYSSGYKSQSFKNNDQELAAIAYKPTSFDPNTATIETMIASGVPITSAKRIIKYRNKGGRFYNKEKLKNFGFSEEDYQKILPYLKLPEKSGGYVKNYEKKGNENTYKSYQKEPEPEQVLINTTNADELMKFKGIGPGFSKRIINYRNKLGGFIRIEQLQEVYGLPDSTFQHIKDRIVIQQEKINKININTASEEELANHPYIGKFMAGNIVKLRDDLKSFTNITDLRQVPLINEEKYRKIVPYIQL